MKGLSVGNISVYPEIESLEKYIQFLLILNTIIKLINGLKVLYMRNGVVFIQFILT